MSEERIERARKFRQQRYDTNEFLNLDRLDETLAAYADAQSASDPLTAYQQGWGLAKEAAAKHMDITATQFRDAAIGQNSKVYKTCLIANAEILEVAAKTFRSWVCPEAAPHESRADAQSAGPRDDTSETVIPVSCESASLSTTLERQVNSISATKKVSVFPQAVNTPACKKCGKIFLDCQCSSESAAGSAAPATPEYGYKLPSAESGSITVDTQTGKGAGSQRTASPQSTSGVPAPESLSAAPATKPLDALKSDTREPNQEELELANTPEGKLLSQVARETCARFSG